MSDRVELLAAEIDGSADALGTLLLRLVARESQALIRFAREGMDQAWRIRFVGMGSSRFAAELPARRLRAGGTDALAEVASAVDAAEFDPSTLVIAISKSGSTPEVVGAAQAARDAGCPVITVTNDEASPLGRVGTVLPLLAGDEASGIATRSYRHTVALLGWLIELLTDDASQDRRAAVNATQELLATRDVWLAEAADALDGAELIHVVGGPEAHGTREQGALMCREVARIAALPMDPGDWLHVGLYTLWPGGRLVLFGGTPYDEAIARTVHERHATLVAVGPAVDGADVHVPLPTAARADPTIRAIVEPLVMESIALELWRRTDARERTAD